MRTADEWRAWYATTRGRPIEPASILDDILRDFEELEAANRFLTAVVARQDGVEVEV